MRGMHLLHPCLQHNPSNTHPQSLPTAAAATAGTQLLNLLPSNPNEAGRVTTRLLLMLTQLNVDSQACLVKPSIQVHKPESLMRTAQVHHACACPPSTPVPLPHAPRCSASSDPRHITNHCLCSPARQHNQPAQAQPIFSPPPTHALAHTHVHNSHARTHIYRNNSENHLLQHIQALQLKFRGRQEEGASIQNWGIGNAPHGRPFNPRCQGTQRCTDNCTAAVAKGWVGMDGCVDG